MNRAFFITENINSISSLFSQSQNMKNQVVLVSGAAGNLGQATVQFFLNNGNKVVGIVHRKSANPITDQNYEEIISDIANEDGASQSIQAITAHYHSIDIAVLTVGGFTMGSIADTDIGSIRQQYMLNFETAYNLARPILQQMQKQGNGKMFFIGSYAGMSTNKANGVTAYGLAKSLLFYLANLINEETKGKEIFAHVIVPSIIDTPQNRASIPKADFSKWERPEQIAKIIGKYATNNLDKVEIVIQEEL